MAAAEGIALDGGEQIVHMVEQLLRSVVAAWVSVPVAGRHRRVHLLAGDSSCSGLGTCVGGVEWIRGVCHVGILSVVAASRWGVSGCMCVSHVSVHGAQQNCPPDYPPDCPPWGGQLIVHRIIPPFRILQLSTFALRGGIV